VATVEAIAMVGAVPVFVDVDAEDCTMLVQQVEDAITARTAAIVPVHLYGQTVDMDPLLAVANRHGIPVVEDASQAHGAEYKGRRSGSLGTIGCFSLYYSKNLGAYGEAGVIVTDDDSLNERVRMLRDHGSRDMYRHAVFGVNGRLDEIQAAILRVKLRHLDRWNQSRREHARLYADVLEGTNVHLPVERPNGKHVYYVYVIRTRNRDAMKAYLDAHGIATGIHYPIPVHQQEACRSLLSSRFSLQVTERIVGEILSLPMFPELLSEEIVFIGDRIHAFERSIGRPRATAAC